MRWFWLPLVLFSSLSVQRSTLGERELRPLSDVGLQSLIAHPDPVKNVDPFDPTSHLSKILIPRAPDTENNTMVRNYIATTLKKLGWHIEEDEFTDNTPVGRKKFTNLIATKDPEAPRRIILSAHFDSKYFPSYPENQFLGATDSAAPCAMLLDLAEALNPLLDARQKRLENGEEEDEDTAETTIQLVFFDGEEAFKDWTDTDSIYGARHLAQKWETTYISPHAKRRMLGPSSTEISTIEHLILLDLLGAPQPLIRSFFMDTAWLFDSIVSVERRLGDAGHFTYKDAKGDNKGEAMATGKWVSYFTPRRKSDANWGHIGDDHVPFLHRGVSVLHLISEPFPRVWHTIKDDATALDIPTMRRWNLILRVFMSEYLGLQPAELAKRDRSELVD